MDLKTILLFSLILNVSLFTIAWVVATRIDNYSIVDVLWSYMFAGLTPLVIVFSPGWEIRKIWIAILFALWSLRLGTHLAKRIFSHIDQEDARYTSLRKDYGKHVKLRFFIFFQMQAVSVVLLCLPLLIPSQNEESFLSLWEVLGSVFWMIGLMGEILADFQLKEFIKKPSNRGKVCQNGLWNYSRHPNYFFECMIWLGYGLFALGSPFGGYAWISVGILWTLILFVTGIPYAEKQSLKSKPVAFREYQRTTSVFFPLPKKK